MKLRFNPSSGMKSLTNAIDYINDASLRASNMQPFFMGLESDIIQEVKHEFDASNPNKWEKTSKEWRAYKRKNGYPENIGIYTGALMEAASDSAIKAYYPTGMMWQIAPVESIGFTIKRKIGITTLEFLRGLGTQIVRVILKRI